MSAAASASAISASASPASAAAPPDWSRLKSDAAAHFAAKRFDAARRGYEAAIHARMLLAATATVAAAASSNQNAAGSASSSASSSSSSTDLCVLHSNVSACAFQLGDYSAALAAADRALAADPSFLKAHLRRALALEKLATAPAAAAAGSIQDAGGAQAVLHLQEAITTAQKIAQILKSQQVQQQPTAANGAAATPVAPSSGPSLAEVTSTLMRLRSTLATLHARAASPLPFLQALREAAAATPPAAASDAATAAAKDRASLRGLMQLIASSGAARVAALQGGLIEVLIQLALRDAMSMRTRAAAVRALRYMLGTDLASAAGAPASSSVGAGASASALDVAPLRSAAPELLRLFESLRALQAAQGKQVPPPLPTAVAALGNMLRALCGLLARLAVHPALEHAFTAQICSALAAALPRYSTHSPAALAALWSFSPSSASLVRLCIAAIDALTFVASSPVLPAAVSAAMREQWLGLLLLEPLAAAAAHDQQATSAAGGAAAGAAIAGGAQLRSAILGAVAVLTRNAMPRAGAGAAASAAAANSVLASMAPMLSKAFGSSAVSPAGQSDMTEEQLKALEAEGAQIREQSLRLIYAPLIGSIEAPTPSSAASPSSDQSAMKLNYTTATRLVRGLSLLLQANTMLGIYVVTFGAAPASKSNDDAAKGKMASVSEEEAEEEAKEEQKQKESADAASSSSSSSVDPAAAAAAAPTVLHLLLSLSSYVSQPLPSSASSSSSSPASPGAPPKPLQLLAAEVLALSSSDASIRSTLVALSGQSAAEDEELRAEGIVSQARGADVFMDLIVQYTEARDMGLEDGPQQQRAAQSPSKQAMTDGEEAFVPNETIVAHACLALSKLVAVGEWGSNVPLPALASGAAKEDEAEPEELDISDAAHQDLSILLHILAALIEKHAAAVPRVEKAAETEAKAAAKRAAAAAAAAKGEEEDDATLTDEDDSASLLSESLRLQRVSLLHLLFESLSYLSLHAYAKKWIVAERGGRALRMLVGIATGTAASDATNGSAASSSATGVPLGVVSDSTIRYALLHCFRNLVTSRSSLQAVHNAEVEALKKLASRGLGAAAGSQGGAALNEQQNARQQYLAGSAEMIAVLTKVLAAARVGAALVQLHKAYVIQAQEMEGSSVAVSTMAAAQKDAASASASGSSPAAAKSNAILSPALANTFAFTLLQLATLPDNRGLLVQQGCVRLLLDLYAGSTKPGDPAAASASSDENASASSPNSPFRCATDCLLSLARLFISTNPALVSEAQLPSVVIALLEGLASSEHELQTFEALMALTNLASFKSGGAAGGSDGQEGGLDLAEYICVGAASARSASSSSAAAAAVSSSRPSDDLNGWFLAKSNLVSSNPLVQRACVELMTNLVGTAWLRTRLRAVEVELRMAAQQGQPSGSPAAAKVTKAEHAASYAAALANPEKPQCEDLRLLLAFALSEDVATASAATGALAMLSNDELIAARIACTRVVSYVSLSEAAAQEEKRAEDPSVVGTTAEEGRQAPPNTRPLVRTGASICTKLLSDAHTHPDVKLRVQVLQDNMAAGAQAVRAAGSQLVKSK